MIRAIVVIFILLPILSCGKKGSLEYPSDKPQTSITKIKYIIHS